MSTPARDGAGRPVRERPLLGLALIAAAIVVIIVGVDRLSFGGGGAGAALNTQPNAIGVVVELPAPASTGGSPGSTSTSTPTSTSTAKSSTTTQPSTTTTLPSARSGIISVLSARGYLIKDVIVNPSPPASTEIEWIHIHGSLATADYLAGLLGFPRSDVVLYKGPRLPSGTYVVIVLAASA